MSDSIDSKNRSKLDEFRADKDQFFKNDPQGPLTKEQRKIFKGLSYFPENKRMRFETELEVFQTPEEIEIQTSTGDIQKYRRYGRFHFEVDGQNAELTIYDDGHGFFLPFVDSLAGKETYAAGRYLEPDRISRNRFLIDFNMAYNPYCAYNERWSCPLTPFENRIKVPIRAGEKIPEGDWAAHE
jgi:uncharacterized protein